MFGRHFFAIANNDALRRDQHMDFCEVGVRCEYIFSNDIIGLRIMLVNCFSLLTRAVNATGEDSEIELRHSC